MYAARKLGGGMLPQKEQIMKRYILLLTTLCIIGFLQAQSLQIENKIKQFAPVSPEAGRLMQEIDYPIDYSVGSINLTIPLHTIKTRDLTLPITLKCNTSGLKLGEHDGWITKGWTLDAEPMITRDKRGGVDENGYAKYNDKFGSSRREIMESVLMGGFDEQPDIFYYKTLVNSGKFIFKRPLSAAESYSYKPIFFPASPNKLMISSLQNGIQMKDPKGNLYVYGDSNQSREITEINYTSVITNWKASKIVSLQKDSITFAYESIYLPQGIKNEIASSYDYYAVEDNASSRDYYAYGSSTRSVHVHDGGYWLGVDGRAEYYKSTGYTHNTSTNTYTINGFERDQYANSTSYYPTPAKVLPRILKKIQFSGGRVEFITTDNSLQQINVYENNTCLKTITFTYSRFGYPRNERRLDKLTILDKITNKPEIYTFTYDETAYTGHLSKAMDYWGYYNGANNTNLVPRQTIQMGLAAPTPRGYYGAATIGTANREPNIICARHTLKTITYPTGLKDEFTYELHKYKDPRTSQIKQAGGLRIRSIYSYNHDRSILKRREFRYGDNDEGVIWIPPYPELYQQHHTKEYRYANWTDSRRYRIFSSNSVMSLTNSNGSPVLYNKVTEIIGGDVKTVYRYDCYSNYSLATSPGYVPRFIRDNMDEWSRNKLTKKENLVKENNVEKVRNEESYNYTTFTMPGNANSTDVALIHDEKILVGLGGSTGVDYKLFYRDGYTLTGNQIRPQTGITEKEYNYTTNNHLQKSTVSTFGTTEYDVRTAQPIKVSTQNSDGSTKVVEYTYPYHGTVDYARLMVNQNELSSPLSEKYKTIRDNVTTGEQDVLFTYSASNSGYLPYRQNGLYLRDVQTNFSKEIEQYLNYDAQGNLTEYIRKDGVKVTLLWGYNYQHLIAEIVGINYSTVISGLGCTYAALQTKDEAALQTLFNTFRRRLQGYVTSYTWYPSRGLSTVTDPRGVVTDYKYDGMGRLIGQDIIVNGVRNKQKSYNYNFKQP